jgi:TetR/AcrR family transcriptional regulator, fatty acid metabolism regulator protein
MANAGYFPGHERRRQILAGAKKVFAARGYHETNISHICDDLGIARGTLYQYFDSKKAVFSAIVEDLLDRVRTAVESRSMPQLRPGVALKRDDIIAFTAASLRHVLAAAFEDEASLRILVREAVGLDVEIDAILRAIDEITVDRFAKDIATAKEAGILRDDVDPRSASLFVIGGIQKLALDALSQNRSIDLDALARQAAELQMSGLLSKKVKR